MTDYIMVQDVHLSEAALQVRFFLATQYNWRTRLERESVALDTKTMAGIMSNRIASSALRRVLTKLNNN